ncbi:unnamed protein product [Ambrosiozyma monospora]|uniref:Unnamed protein product n=1 Tax=Ambrosiozyma monospora TaxID=43982 RepID=A0ACB5U2M5_AMBMO|nr:unnamed protein product [Ambrosiozyma monospora]
MFIVVNKFDNIKNKKRCQRSIMDQINSLSPDIHENAGEFVHFVSSKDVLDKIPDGGDGGDGPGGNDDPDNRDYSSPEFDHLEGSLRNYLLEKRSVSKLLPAKNYLIKFYSDVLELSKINLNIYEKEHTQKTNELNDINPSFEKLKNASGDVSEKINKIIESTSSEVYDHAKMFISHTIDNVDEIELGIPFNGYASLQDFAYKTQTRVYDVITSSVSQSEDFARDKTAAAVTDIRAIDILYKENYKQIYHLLILLIQIWKVSVNNLVSIFQTMRQIWLWA